MEICSFRETPCNITEEETAEEGSNWVAIKKSQNTIESSFSKILCITELHCRWNCHLKASQGESSSKQSGFSSMKKTE